MQQNYALNTRSRTRLNLSILASLPDLFNRTMRSKAVPGRVYIVDSGILPDKFNRSMDPKVVLQARARMRPLSTLPYSGSEWLLSRATLDVINRAGESGHANSHLCRDTFIIILSIGRRFFVRVRCAPFPPGICFKLGPSLDCALAARLLVFIKLKLII